MNTQYKVVVKKDSMVIIYVIEKTKKKAKSQLKKFRKEFPDYNVQINYHEKLNEHFV